MRNPLSPNFTNKLQHLFDQTGPSVLLLLYRDSKNRKELIYK